MQMNLCGVRALVLDHVMPVSELLFFFSFLFLHLLLPLSSRNPWRLPPRRKWSKKLCHVERHILGPIGRVDFPN